MESSVDDKFHREVHTMRNTIHTPLQVHEPRTLGEVRLQADMLRGQVLATLIRRCSNLFRGTERQRDHRRAM